MNEYLWEFAQAFPSENRFQVILKSALSMTAAASAEVSKTNDKWMCRKCKTLWMHGCFLADEVAGTDRYDALIEKHRESVAERERNRKHRRRYEYIMSRKGATVKYTCTICSYKTRLPVKDGENKPVRTAPVAPIAAQPTTSKKNRKRKKDPTAGLTIAVPSKKKGNLSQAIVANKPTMFSSKQPSHLQALAAALEKKKAGQSEETVDRLKLLLR